MKERKTKDRGQVGIGTLIVFIAMVLVAAIAAGVLINTAGFLQTQAEDTGEESTAAVANNLLVLSEVGVYDGDNVSSINLTVQKAAGASDINLEQITIHYIGPGGAEHLIFNETDSDFALNEISADGPDNVLVNTDDRYEIAIDLSELDGLTALEEGDTASLQLTTGDGAQKMVTVKVPDSLASYEVGDVVNL